MRRKALLLKGIRIPGLFLKSALCAKLRLKEGVVLHEMDQGDRSGIALFTLDSTTLENFLKRFTIIQIKV